MFYYLKQLIKEEITREIRKYLETNEVIERSESSSKKKICSCICLHEKNSSQINNMNLYLKELGNAPSKNRQIINARKGVEKREPSCTVGGNVN